MKRSTSTRNGTLAGVAVGVGVGGSGGPYAISLSQSSPAVLSQAQGSSHPQQLFSPILPRYSTPTHPNVPSSIIPSYRTPVMTESPTPALSMLSLDSNVVPVQMSDIRKSGGLEATTPIPMPTPTQTQTQTQERERRLSERGKNGIRTQGSLERRKKDKNQKKRSLNILLHDKHIQQTGQTGIFEAEPPPSHTVKTIIPVGLYPFILQQNNPTNFRTSTEIPPVFSNLTPIRQERIVPRQAPPQNSLTSTMFIPSPYQIPPQPQNWGLRTSATQTVPPHNIRTVPSQLPTRPLYNPSPLPNAPPKAHGSRINIVSSSVPTTSTITSPPLQFS